MMVVGWEEEVLGQVLVLARVGRDKRDGDGGVGLRGGVGLMRRWISLTLGDLWEIQSMGMWVYDGMIGRCRACWASFWNAVGTGNWESLEYTPNTRCFLGWLAFIF